MRIQKIGVVGCGTVAQGIALNIAHAKLEVIMYDETENWLKDGLSGIELTIDNEISRWGLTPADKKAIMSRISTTMKMRELKDVQILIEAKGRSLEEKAKIFMDMEAICHDTTIFMTNTTTIGVTDVQKQLMFPERIIGLHFILPVHKSIIVEVIKGIHTTEDVVKTTKFLMDTLGKKSIEVYEYPGFVTTRIIMPMINTAAHVLLEGLASAEDIDRAINLGYNLTQGPLAMADEMGIDVALTYLDSIYKQLGDPSYRPCPLFRKMVREGRLGVKSGHGFFKYDKMKRRIQNS
jgi:3-hydroxybutyryl-CoA dehydrogenase